MKINLWYSQHQKQWRWTMTIEVDSKLHQESGQQPNLRVAMNDIANTVEYLLDGV